MQRMTLTPLKWLIALIILITSLAAGHVSLHIANRYKRLLSLCDSVANGIFIGAAIFHLFPSAVFNFSHCPQCHPYLKVLLTSLCSLVGLYFLERWITSNRNRFKKLSSAWSLILILSIHAFIAGFALGISESIAIVSTVFIAIMAHKSFEIFALVINLHRRVNAKYSTRLIFMVFSLVTPLGILLGCSGDALLPLASNNALTAYFDAIAAGTFFYIATIHTQHQHHPFDDSYHLYTQALGTICGTIAMALLAIWA